MLRGIQASCFKQTCLNGAQRSWQSLYRVYKLVLYDPSLALDFSLLCLLLSKHVKSGKSWQQSWICLKLTIKMLALQMQISRIFFVLRLSKSEYFTALRSTECYKSCFILFQMLQDKLSWLNAIFIFASACLHISKPTSPRYSYKSRAQRTYMQSYPCERFKN